MRDAAKLSVKKGQGQNQMKRTIPAAAIALLATCSSAFAIPISTIGSSDALFLVKTGSGVGINGISGTYDTFLFQNLSSLFDGVMDLDLLTGSHGQVEMGMVNYAGITTEPGSTPVSEPGTLGLVGLGLGGLLVARRRGMLTPD